MKPNIVHLYNLAQEKGYSTDFLAESIFYLSQQKTQSGLLPTGKVQIHHLAPRQHTFYRDIPTLLSAEAIIVPRTIDGSLLRALVIGDGRFS